MAEELQVSEDKLRALFAEFKLDLLRELEKYATLASLNQLEQRVHTLELWKAGRSSVGEWQRWVIPVAISVAVVVVAVVAVFYGGRR